MVVVKVRVLTQEFQNGQQARGEMLITGHCWVTMSE